METQKTKKKKENEYSSIMIIAGVLLFYLLSSVVFAGHINKASLTGLDMLAILTMVLLISTTLEASATTIFQSMLYLLVMVFAGVMLIDNALIIGVLSSNIPVLVILLIGTMLILIGRLSLLISNLTKEVGKKEKK
jgi:hypothetical protein